MEKCLKKKPTKTATSILVNSITAVATATASIAGLMAIYGTAAIATAIATATECS